MDEKQKLLEDAALGEELESFWSSAIGKHLRQRAEAVYIAALEELKECDPTDHKKISRLQGEVWRAEKFGEWINEGIATGLAAFGILKGIESTDD